MTRLGMAFLIVGLLGTVAIAQTGQKRIVPPIRGEAQIEVVGPDTSVAGGEIVSKFRIRNASTGSIALLTISETWYDKQGNALGGDSERWKKPFAPGEIIEMELRTPKKPEFFSNNFQFSHANGKVKVTKVRSFPTTTPAPKK